MTDQATPKHQNHLNNSLIPHNYVVLCIGNVDCIELLAYIFSVIWTQVESLGGKTTVAREPNKGTEFGIVFNI